MIVMTGRCNSAAQPHSRGRSDVSRLCGHTSSYADTRNSLFNRPVSLGCDEVELRAWAGKAAGDKLAVCCIDILEHTRGDHLPS